MLKRRQQIRGLVLNSHPSTDSRYCLVSYMATLRPGLHSKRDLHRFYESKRWKASRQTNNMCKTGDESYHYTCCQEEKSPKPQARKLKPLLSCVCSRPDTLPVASPSIPLTYCIIQAVYLSVREASSDTLPYRCAVEKKSQKASSVLQKKRKFKISAEGNKTRLSAPNTLDSQLRIFENSTMSTLFEDSFKTTSVDSARYDRVSRITAQSLNHDDIHLTLDVNTELFPMSKGDVVTVALASQLTDKETTYSGWREPKVGEKSLADDYDYVMYGTVYKFEEGSGEKV